MLRSQMVGAHTGAGRGHDPLGLCRGEHGAGRDPAAFALSLPLQSALLWTWSPVSGEVLMELSPGLSPTSLSARGGGSSSQLPLEPELWEGQAFLQFKAIFLKYSLF